MIPNIKKHIPALIALLSFGALTSCDDDNVKDDPNTLPPATVVATSVADGATVSPDLKEITVEYSEPVALNQAVKATLNGVEVPTVLEDNKILKATVVLSEGADYTFVVPRRCVATIAAEKFCDEVTVKFRTEGVNIPVGDMALVNPNATNAAKDVYAFLVQNIGKKIVSGAMANVNNNNDFSDWIDKITGVYPGMTCYDFIHLPESGQNWIDYNDITPAQAQWNAHGMVGYMWHWRVPTDKDAYDKKDYNRYGARVPSDNVEGPTEFDIREALKEGTWQHEFILADLDKVSAVFKKLEAAGIAVLWRPLHEAAGSYEYNNPWFWWGRYGSEYTKQLWKLMYDRIVNVNGVNNLIWVWTAQYSAGHDQEMAADYPGNDCVDILGVDIYPQAGDDSSHKDAYVAVRNMGKSLKPVALAEVGYMPDPDKCLQDGANWSYFTLWYTYDQHKKGEEADGFGNTPAHLKAVFTAPSVLNRAQLPGW